MRELTVRWRLPGRRGGKIRWWNVLWEVWREITWWREDAAPTCASAVVISSAAVAIASAIVVAAATVAGASSSVFETPTLIEVPASAASSTPGAAPTTTLLLTAHFRLIVRCKCLGRELYTFEED